MAEAGFKLEIGTQSWFSAKVCGLDKKKKKSELRVWNGNNAAIRPKSKS